MSGSAPVPGTPAGGPTAYGTAPKYTRPPGMPAPPGVGRASVPTGATQTGGLRTVPITAGAARLQEAARRAGAAVSSVGGRGPRRARLYVKRIDPWSVMKFSFAVSFVLLIVGVVATSVLYLALDAMGVFESINKALADMVGATGGNDTGGFKITAKGVIFGSALIGAVNVVLFTALATLGAFIYNVCSDLVGGIEVTLSERD